MSVMNKLKLFSLMLILLLTACSTAKISELPQGINEVNIKDYKNTENKGSNWTWETGDRYFLSVENVTREELIAAIVSALENQGYSIEKNKHKEQAILATRGIRANEYGSVVGVYYKSNNKGFDIYIENRITQDIVGGVTAYRSKEVSDAIQVTIR